MAPCDFYLIGKLHLAIKGKRFASVEAIQKTCTDILKDIPVNDLKHSFEKLLDRAKQCIKAGGDYTRGQNYGTTYKNCIKNMLVFESGYLREQLS